MKVMSHHWKKKKKVWTYRKVLFSNIHLPDIFRIRAFPILQTSLNPKGINIHAFIKELSPKCWFYCCPHIEIGFHHNNGEYHKA